MATATKKASGFPVAEAAKAWFSLGFEQNVVATLARAWGLRRLLQKTHALGERGYVRGGVLRQSLVLQWLFYYFEVFVPDRGSSTLSKPKKKAGELGLLTGFELPKVFRLATETSPGRRIRLCTRRPAKATREAWQPLVQLVHVRTIDE